MDKQGQRLLLALASTTDDAGEFFNMFSLEGIVAAAGGILCLVFVVIMCTCKKEEHKDGDENLELHQSSKKGEKKSMVQQTQDLGDTKPRSDVEVVVVNGGTTQASRTLPGHSRQASSGSAHMRPTSLRELPEPPISSHHSRNKSLSGVEALSTSAKGSTGAGAPGAGSTDFPYHQHGHHARNCKSVPSVNIVASMDKDKPHSDGYDHLGPKRCIKPTDYDSLAEPESTDGETPVSETSGVLDGHYSQLRERTYAVVGDVKARAKELFNPYSNVKDKDDGSSGYYSQVKEDPYNDIDDSGGNVSLSFIHRLRQSRDADDPYTTVQDGSRSNMKRGLEPRVPASLPPNIAATSGRMLPPPAIPDDDDDGDAEEEYAVVQKAKGTSEPGTEDGGHTYSGGDISPYSMGPPEPPRLYNDYDSLEESSSLSPPSYSREHKYSKVTARESLASMSARNALNPYEMVMDLPENTYATVDGGSGDGVVLRGGVAACDSTENRLSQTSDTYAEIGISGAGLSSSIISSSSSTGGNNNSSSSVAPIPPSLDSLHLMTKSQTSSEGDRLSDRHLASPEDSAMSLNIWGDSHEDEDSEDGYSTLKKPESPPQSSSVPAIPDSTLITDEDSGEVTLVPNYQTVKDCISDNEIMEEIENDPNYESVEEMRAKVAQLTAKAISLDSRTSPFIPNPGTNMHVTAHKGFSTNSSVNVAVDSSPHDLPSGPRRRKLDHDYEEVDLSAPSSPVTPSSSMNHSASSSYLITSISTSYATASSQMGTEAILDVTEVRERVIQSHMYEELTEVRAKTSQMSKVRKSHSLVKNSSEDKVKTSKKKSEEKVKSSSEKKKVVLEDKQKGGSADKRKGGAGDKQKEDKRKGGSEDKRKKEDKKLAGDGKRKGGAEDKRCDLTSLSVTRL